MIISVHGISPRAQVAKAFSFGPHLGGIGYWPGGPILCAAGTANAVGDAWWMRDALFLTPANGNWGKVGKGARFSSGAFIQP
jgi:hypothetical protein